MSDTQLPRGSLLNACYSIDKVLGRGGFGITYLATDTKLNLPVAVKEYLPAPFAQRAENNDVEPFQNKQYEFDWGLDRFLSEAQILAQFKHPNIVRVNAAFEQYGTAYMVMEYEQGVSLAEYIRQQDNDMSQAFFEKFVLAIMGGLQGIHDKGFIHRDIKPANLMVRADFEKTPVLIDFGSARSTAGSETAKLTAVTSAGYSPVEQHNTELGEQGPWTDIYALAASIREALTGEVPRASLDREFAVRAGPEKDPLRPMSEIYIDRGFSHEFLHAIDAGLSIMPDDRPKSLADWRGLFEGKPLPVQQSSAAQTGGVVEQPGAGVVTEVMPTPGQLPEQVTAIPANDAIETAIPIGAGNDSETVVAQPEGLISKAGNQNTVSAGGNQELKKDGSSKAPLLAGLAAVVLGAGAFGFFQITGTDSAGDKTPPTPVADSSPGSVVSDAPELQSLPKPNVPIELISPVDRVKQQVVALNAAADPFVQLVDSGGGVPDAAAEPIEMLFIKYKSLSESDIVLAFPDLKKEVISGLDRLSVANSDAEELKRTLENTAITDIGKIDESLQDWENLNGERRSELIYSLASLSAEQRASLGKQTELTALVEQVNSSIRSKLETGDFQNAARILEVALLFGGGNETMESYRAFLNLEN